MSKFSLFFLFISFFVTLNSLAETPSMLDSFRLGDVSNYNMGSSSVEGSCKKGFFGFDAEGSMLSCVDNFWVKMSASYIAGTLCGINHPVTGGRSCGGLSPTYGCPSGYSRKYYIDTAYHSDYAERGLKVYHCVKN